MNATEVASIELACEGASASLALRGAEPMAWRVEGRDLLWCGDPAHWEQRAPILFPVVGQSVAGRVRVGSRSYRMPRHGFAQASLFAIADRSPDSVRLRLTDTAASRSHYPFAFALDVEARLAPAQLSLAFAVTNTGAEEMPYGLGFHPAFPWPFAAPGFRDHAVVFEAEERAEVPQIVGDGLIGRERRSLPLQGRRLPLDPALFTEALCFLDARSRSLAFTAPSGAAIVMEVESFPHLALWTRPGAPFLSMECWTTHADLEGFCGSLAERASMICLAPGETMRHAVRLTWRERA